MLWTKKQSSWPGDCVFTLRRGMNASRQDLKAGLTSGCSLSSADPMILTHGSNSVGHITLLNPSIHTSPQYPTIPCLELCVSLLVGAALGPKVFLNPSCTHRNVMSHGLQAHVSASLGNAEILHHPSWLILGE